MIDSRPTDTGPVLHADDVDVVRDGNHLLRSVSLQVHPGQHWALLGANGAGKTTLLNLLGAINHPTRGSVTVLGHRLGRVDMRQLRSYVGHINPRHPLRSPLRVRDVVLTGVTNTTELVPRWQPTQQQADQADRLISTLGMSEKAQARWETLSQGERGRTLIARALMPVPRLLLLDEPATGLDLAAREQLLTSLDDLRAEHPQLATVLVTHHLEELPASTTHAMLLRDGQCLASGEVDEVITTDHISKCFDHPVRITRTDGRWHARA
ncbi:iron complex transport system ATP-binding protein [Saccharopolyspora kobensis]|uniref:Iron complex transport system ATP-binding protein n=1 Tax=Saccharopolyspora kobensis TaxID=146035 RepID=A0A1H5WSS7_9PSEU|nr:ATP-binding cassette domain-containing protein [Saccharopolyspora kobensis]SEG02047.1 iron complex transport system ATP-binding protein [Saccharopolyspora kobensis]SFD78810.1 iron complex transport system ATP-binding protein [Saccharopolyspora kobensis]